MTITLSISAITDNILAHVAMQRRFNHAIGETLSRDRRPAIARLARGAAAPVALALMPEIIGCNVLDSAGCAGAEEPEDDIITFELRENNTSDPIALRLLIEHTVTARILADIYAGVDHRTAAIFTDDYSASLRTISRTVSAQTRPVRLRPYPQ